MPSLIHDSKAVFPTALTPIQRTPEEIWIEETRKRLFMLLELKAPYLMQDEYEKAVKGIINLFKSEGEAYKTGSAYTYAISHGWSQYGKLSFDSIITWSRTPEGGLFWGIINRAGGILLAPQIKK